MQIQEWAAIGEIVGAIGIIATLIYLSIQIRQNTKSTETSTISAFMESYSSATRAWGASTELARVVRIGNTDFDSLNEDEKFQYFALIGQFFVNFESLFSLFESGVLDPRRWATIKADIAAFVHFSGGRVFWKQTREAWVGYPEFVELVDHLASQDDKPSHLENWGA